MTSCVFREPFGRVYDLRVARPIARTLAGSDCITTKRQNKRPSRDSDVQN